MMLSIMYSQVKTMQRRVYNANYTDAGDIQPQ